MDIHFKKQNINGRMQKKRRHRVFIPSIEQLIAIDGNDCVTVECSIGGYQIPL